MISPHGTEHPLGTQDIPHGTQDIPPRYSRYPPTVLMISPHGTHDIPHGTEHPPRYCTHIIQGGDHQIVKYSLKFVHSMSESIDFFWSLFYIQYSKTDNSHFFGIINNRLFISQSLTVLGPLREKFNFSVQGFP